MPIRRHRGRVSTRCRRRGGRAWLTTAVCALLVACTGVNDTAAERTTLNVVMADDWAGTAAITDAVRDFERAHEDVRVHVHGFPFSQIPDVIAARSETDDPIDLAHWHAFAAAGRELAEPIDDLWAAHLTEDEYFPGAVNTVVWDGRYYGVPLDVNALLLLANRDLLDQAGFNSAHEIVTFADVEAVSEAVTDDGGVRGIALAHSSWATYGWIRANGGELVTIDDDGRASVTLDHPGVVEALDALGGLVERGIAFPPLGRDVVGDAFSLFRGGSTALHVTGTWDIASLEADPPPWRYEVVGMPRGPSAQGPGTALGGSSLFIPRGVDDRDLAFEFALHLTADDYALRYAQEEGRMPARPRVFEDEFFADPDYRTLARQLEAAAPMRLIAFPEADAAFSHAMEAILTGREDAATALGRAQRTAEAASDPP